MVFSRKLANPFFVILNFIKINIKKIENKNPSDKNGWTPIHEAAKYGQWVVVRFIFDKIGFKNPNDHKGQTPLHLGTFQLLRNQDISLPFQISNFPTLF